MDDITEYTKEAFALIRLPDKGGQARYAIREKAYRAYVHIDDSELDNAIVQKLLAEGAEIFNSPKDFSNKYPALTDEEINRIAIENMENLAKNAAKKNENK